MKKLLSLFAVTAVAASVAALRAASITVNTADSTDFSAGKTNLVTAIKSLNDGDTITFNIPGTAGQVHYLLTPAGGYPIITNNSVSHDGIHGYPNGAPGDSDFNVKNTVGIPNTFIGVTTPVTQT